MIHAERVRALNRKPSNGGEFVVYWMQAAQRVACNHALEFAVREANAAGRPLVVFFGLTASFPEANERHYTFMLEGLAETERELRGRGIRMSVRPGPPVEGVVEIGRRASLIVVDDGYLRVERRWRRDAAARLERPLVEVATNVVVPVRSASAKEEYAAATLRPRILPLLPTFLAPLAETEPRKNSLRLEVDSLDIRNPAGVLNGLGVAGGPGPVHGLRGGASEARRKLQAFVAGGLARYAVDRSDPGLDATSHLSPYLHFGQISPLQIALEAGRGPRFGRAEFLEQLIVRRELAVNFVHYVGAYDRFEALPAWSRQTLLERASDRREHTYSTSELERAATHDRFWNAAQMEMILTGTMHGTMRMYWGKKILEWAASPRRAFRTALALNNRYELDGRDPNGFAGVAWCFGKHDRPWPPRPVFGTVRAMGPAGLRRKYDIEAYVSRIESLAADRAAPAT